ncbi:uncharacterized protein LOC115083229 [Rhinatrema bivittatum]|uniref:uncharacterized protein LOC115083229 n=1 Tax=Rhinatrema bivittatum TaxID=194408 RepID=UPI00112BFBE3|nr:uncharacterized protein LOC115083229 [Rhinatrema bivittatum]
MHFHLILAFQMQAAARGEIDQYGRPIRTLTQAEMMQAAARGEIDQYGRPIRTLTQAEMMREVPGQRPEQRVLTIEEQKRMQQAFKWGPEQPQYPIQQRTQAQLEAAKWETDQYGRPIRDLKLAQVMLGLPGSRPEQRYLATEEQQRKAAQWPTDQYGRPIQDYEQLQMMQGIPEQEPMQTGPVIGPQRKIAPGWKIDVFGQLVRQQDQQAEMITPPPTSYPDETRVPLHLIRRDQMTEDISKSQARKFLRQLGGPHLADSLMSKTISSKLRYEQLLITGVGLQQAKDKQTTLIPPKANKWFLPYSVQMLHLFFPFFDEENMRMNQLYGKSIFKQLRGQVPPHTTEMKKRFKGNDRMSVQYTPIVQSPTLLRIGPNIRHLSLISRAQPAAEKKTVPSTTKFRAPYFPRQLPSFYKTSTVHHDYFPRRLYPKYGSSLATNIGRDIPRILDKTPPVRWDPHLFTSRAFVRSSKSRKVEIQSIFKARTSNPWQF